MAISYSARTWQGQFRNFPLQINRKIMTAAMIISRSQPFPSSIPKEEYVNYLGHRVTVVLKETLSSFNCPHS